MERNQKIERLEMTPEEIMMLLKKEIKKNSSRKPNLKTSLSQSVSRII